MHKAFETFTKELKDILSLSDEQAEKLAQSISDYARHLIDEHNADRSRRWD